MQTVKFGDQEIPLATAPSVAGNVTSFVLAPSDTVTAEAVYAVVSEASAYTISTDGIDAPAQDNVELTGNVGYDGTNITFQMRRKSEDAIQREKTASQIAQLQDTVDELVLTTLGVE